VRKLVLIAVFGQVLSGCVTPNDDDAPGAKAAQRLADRACTAKWGAEADNKWMNVEKALHTWHVRMKGDHWEAWTGNEKRPDVTIDVPRDGTLPDPKSCNAWVYVD
jgi:hypothetical protein